MYNLLLALFSTWAEVELVELDPRHCQDTAPMSDISDIHVSRFEVQDSRLDVDRLPDRSRSTGLWNLTTVDISAKLELESAVNRTFEGGDHQLGAHVHADWANTE